MLTVVPNSLQAWFNWLISCCRSRSVCMAKAASSAESFSLMSTVRILVFALRWAKLNNLRLLRLRKYTLSLDYVNANLNNMEKKMANKIGSKKRHCFTPLWIVKDTEVSTSELTTRFMLLSKDGDNSRQLWGTVNFHFNWERHFLLTKSNVFEWLMKVMDSGICC